MKIRIIAIALFLSAAAVTAHAQTATPGVTSSQVHQTKRIAQGVKSGELTRKERKALARQQRRINRSKKVAKADGMVTPKERAVLNARQKNASRNIYRQKHDGQSRK